LCWVSEFIQQISKTSAIARKALIFLILTATHSNEVRGAMWYEIDFEKMVWTIPAKRMKAGKEHRIPLAPQAIEILQSVPRLSNEQNLIFPSPYGGKL
jgi:integrase